MGICLSGNCPAWTRVAPWPNWVPCGQVQEGETIPVSCRLFPPPSAPTRVGRSVSAAMGSRSLAPASLFCPPCNSGSAVGAFICWIYSYLNSWVLGKTFNISLLEGIFCIIIVCMLHFLWIVSLWYNIIKACTRGTSPHFPSLSQNSSTWRMVLQFRKPLGRHCSPDPKEHWGQAMFEENTILFLFIGA